MHVDIKVTTWQRIHLPDYVTQADLQTIIESIQESPLGNDLFDKWDCELETADEAEYPYMENGQPIFEVWDNDKVLAYNGALGIIIP